MYKEATFKKKFEDLNQWVPEIIDAIKKDLKQDHLSKDPLFLKKFFSGKNLAKLTSDDLTAVYRKVIEEQEGGEQIAEFIASRWLLKNSELYNFFEEKLSKISSDFTAIEELTEEQAVSLLRDADKEFGAIKTYIFSVLNSVVFSEKKYHELKESAEKSYRARIQAAQMDAEEEAKIKEARAYEVEISRLKDKYEKKISGLEKKYITDVDTLKKQVAQLQRKLQGSAS